MSLQAEIPSFLTGAGGAGMLGWLWLRNTLARNEKLGADLDASQDRERALTAKVIEALVLNKTFLETHQGELSGLGETLKLELGKVTEKLDDLSNELLHGKD
jgi:hypothetical protein